MTIKKIDTLQNGSQKVKVAVRIRPFNQKECNAQNVIKISGESTIFLAHPTREKQPRPFTFDFCFAPNPKENAANLDNSMDSVESNASIEFCQNGGQEQVFRSIGMEMVENAFLGFNTSVFAYGQTGTGKSYTMMGNSQEPGIIPRLCTELFDRASREMDEANRIKVEISFYEIYNERIRDLLRSEHEKRPLRVREHSLFGPMVEGLSTYVVNSFEQIERLIAQGNGLRTTAATQMNEESSRSHGVFTIKLTQTISDVDDKKFTGEKISKISLVDLAGSERVQKTGATGKRLEEGSNINKSLSALGKVIAALASEQQQKGGNGNGFIPYRDSVLTWLLKENLGGNSRTTMIATISSAFSNYEETLSTLRFADSAKRIQTHAIVNEDSKAKIIRELREEVDRLRLLNQTHAQQQEAFKMAMEQISERHQHEKKLALEQQYDLFSQYIRELSQNMPTPSSSSTPMTPSSFGPTMFVGMNSSPSSIFRHDLNNNAGIGSSKNKFLEWAYRREELFTGQLRRLRQSIQHAHSLATEANSLIQMLMTYSANSSSFDHSFGFSRLHFSVILQIPARNLRPSKLVELNEEEDGEEEERGLECICEPVILANWANGTKQQQQNGQHLSVEQMECKLAELRALTFSRNSLPSFPQKDSQNEIQHPLMHLFGNLLAKRERHSLIGVANVHLGILFHDFHGPIDIQVLIINQQGEICGKLHVQLQRLTISGGSSEENSFDSMEELLELGGENRPEKLLGKTIICRVEIKKATNLPPEHCSFVFCQYSFYDQSEIVVPGEQGIGHTNVDFDAANEFELVCTRPFLEYVEEDALSIEIWGHRTDGEGDDEEEEMKKEMMPDEFDGEWEELEENLNYENRKQMHEMTERKKKSLRERWEEVTKRLEIWIEIMELNERGEYSAVPILEGNWPTGGIYKIRQGQQRRIQISLRTKDCGGLPFCMEEIESACIGSILVESNEEEGEGGIALDSYHELDLARLRAKWEELLEKRAKYLEKEIHAIGGSNKKKGKKDEFEEERERALLINWIELVEERNVISIPTTGIPGAPPTAQLVKMGAGFEKHCPLIFLQNDPNRFEEEGQENEGERMPKVGANNYLPFEYDDDQLELPIGQRETGENHLSAICHWDSSLHGCSALNMQSAKGERIYLLLKIVLRIGQPFCMSLMLRKRICVEISGPQQSSAIRWSFPWSNRRNTSIEMPFLTGTGLLVDLVACIPRSTLDMENRQMLAKLAVKDATNGKVEWEERIGTNWDGNDKQEHQLPSRCDYLSEYVTKTIQAVEWLIKMDRLRQEEAIGRILARQKRANGHQMMKANCPNGIVGGRMKRTISLPTTINNYLMTPSSSFHTKFETIQDQSQESSLEGTPVRTHQQQKIGPPPTFLHPSQSHNDGFQTNKGHQYHSSPNSSGYASMVTSVINPCPLRLTGIEEERKECRQQFPLGKEQQMDGTLLENCSKEPVVATINNINSNANANNAQSVNNDVAQTQHRTSCCCENRLFSPPAANLDGKKLLPSIQRRKLFFHNTAINMSSSSNSPFQQFFDSSSIMMNEWNNNEEQCQSTTNTVQSSKLTRQQQFGRQRHFLPN